MRRLTHGRGEGARPAWSADGRWIYFSSDRSGAIDIWRMAADGSDPVQITKHGGSVALASPDGQHVYYKRILNSGPIYEISPDGSGDTEVVSEEVYAVLTYATTTSGLWFVGPPTIARPYWSVRMLRFADRRIVEAARMDVPPDGVGLSVSPDERYVLFTKADLSGNDLWLVDNFR